MSTHSIELRAGELRLALRPDLGGCIAGLWLGGLRCCAAPSRHNCRRRGLRAATRWCRIPTAWLPALSLAGKDYSTEANFDDSPHSVHGVAWQRPWQELSASDTQAEIAYAHEPDAHWPFAFEVRQRFVLDAGSLEMHFAFSNKAGQPQPVGLGWHPYFPSARAAACTWS